MFLWRVRVRVYGCVLCVCVCFIFASLTGPHLLISIMLFVIEIRCLRFLSSIWVLLLFIFLSLFLCGWWSRFFGCLISVILFMLLIALFLWNKWRRTDTRDIIYVWRLVCVLLYVNVSRVVFVCECVFGCVCLDVCAGDDFNASCAWILVWRVCVFFF